MPTERAVYIQCVSLSVTPPRDILRAYTKVRFLLGQYKLQADIAR